jgi:NitT/TauT family transport system ATP-binding protein
MSLSATSPADGAPERIRFDDISMQFATPAGPLEVVEHVSLSIRQGEFVSLVGPSGCGKTTMMNMAAGFLQPTTGSVTLDGRPITAPGPDRGVMFQDYGVFPWLSVEDNVAFGLKLAANRSRRSSAPRSSSAICG